LSIQEEDKTLIGLLLKPKLKTRKPNLYLVQSWYNYQDRNYKIKFRCPEGYTKMKLWIRVVLDHQQEKDSEKADAKQYFEAEVDLEVLLHEAVLINDHRYCVHAIVVIR